jgi:hypothetical protein
MPSNPFDQVFAAPRDSHELPPQVLFSATQLWVAALLTNPVTTGLLLAVNAHTRGQGMLQDLLFCSVVSIAQLVLMHFVSGTGGMMLAWVLVGGASLAWIHSRYDDSLALHENRDGARRSWWWVLLAWLLSIPVVVVLTVIVEVVLG